MRVRKLASDGDLEYVSGRQQMVAGVDAEAQAVRLALSTIKGENLFHPTYGIDLPGLTGGESSRQAAVIRAAIQRSGRTQGTAQIRLEAELDRARRTEYNVSAVLRTGDRFDFGVTV